ncbi:ATP-binding protein [Piscinibacter sp.]|uniref:ATP-binding protein n=1 Tax=Piscinibacter sp. TaxID=1903157 RepID=UPI0039E2BA73
MATIRPLERAGLAARLILLGLLSALLVSAGAAWLLRESLHGVVLRSFAQGLAQRADRLEVELLAARQRGVPLGEAAAGSEFDTIFSGWYWQIGEGADAPRSRSLWDASLDLGAATPDERTEPPLRRAVGPRGEPLLGAARPLALPSGMHTLHVYGAAQETDSEIERIDRVLLTVPLALSAALVLLSVLQARIGLAPVRRLQEALGRVRGGQAERIGDAFGPDLAPLAQEIDEVLLRNARVVERARHHAADLGHALKKPLALLAAQAHQATVPSEAVQRQVTAMNGLIERHLARAASGAGQTRRVGVGEALDGVLALVRHLHGARGLAWRVEVEPGLRWQGHAADLEEVAGNLLDNAGKWARSAVRLTARRDGDRVLLEVEDDGPGLSAEQIGEAARRGRRFDESVAGSGLGLAIVDDIVRTYGGQLALDAAGTLGGLRCRVTL